MSIFDDENLLIKSVEYAVNPPIVIFKDSVSPKMSPSFKELVNKKSKVENKLLEKNLEFVKNGTKSEIIFIEKNKNVVKNEIEKKTINLSENFNGPLKESDSFLESNLKIKLKADKYTKPVAVMMKLPSEPDPKIKKKIEKIEKKRENSESKMFEKVFKKG